MSYNPCLGCTRRYVRKEEGKTVCCRTNCEEWEKKAMADEERKSIIRREKDKESICKGYASENHTKILRWTKSHGGN